MISISVKGAVNTLQSARRQLGERNFARAVSRSLNDTILQARTEGRTQVKSIYNIPQRYLSGINVNKATTVSLIAKLYASSTPIPMDAFSPKFQTPTKSFTITKRGEQKSKAYKALRKSVTPGVSIEVIKGRRATVSYAFLIPGAKPRVFARGEYEPGSSYGFVRRRKRVNQQGSDTPVKPLLSVSVHSAVINKKSLAKIETRINNVFPAIMERNISFMISQIKQ